MKVKVVNSTKKLIFWEMNEINFEFIRYYISQGKLLIWAEFIDKYGLVETVSESRYEYLEPWIQWPTVRTGLTYSEHKIFRLGDLESSGVKQHWEIIEDANYRVAALSPINGSNRTKKSRFWIPDPWVDTKVSGGGFEKNIAVAIKQVVNENASGKISLASLKTIAFALLTKSKLSSISVYFSALYGALRGQHWSKALLLDRLLADIFIWQYKRDRPDFATLFTNCGAHIQHHYMCSSPAYKGKTTNPKWYVPEGKDPLLEVLILYETILSDLMKLEGTRIMIAVGMRQVPHEEPIIYWRLKSHKNFLTTIGLDFLDVKPRMTRDFLVLCKSKELAYKGEALLRSVISEDGVPIFGVVDNRGESLYVTLTYPEDIGPGFKIFGEFGTIDNFKDHVVFVAIKNGKHDTGGYFLDTDCELGHSVGAVPLPTLFKLILKNFGLC